MEDATKNEGIEFKPGSFYMVNEKELAVSFLGYGSHFVELDADVPENKKIYNLSRAQVNSALKKGETIVALLMVFYDDGSIGLVLYPTKKEEYPAEAILLSYLPFTEVEPFAKFTTWVDPEAKPE